MKYIVVSYMLVVRVLVLLEIKVWAILSDSFGWKIFRIMPGSQES